ncbi:Trk system potassium transporter TrkA [Caminibacter profundus]
MDILIVGAGKVGYFLAKSLSKIHNVTIVDKNEKALEKIYNNIDVLTIHSDIRNPLISEYLDNYYDYLICVTNIDEINIVANIILNNKIKIKHSIIRLSNIDYISSPFYKILNSRLIFPFVLTASSIAKLMYFPKANNIKSFPFINYLLVSITAKSPQIISIEEINKDNIIVVGIKRKEDFTFTNGNATIQDKDLVYIFGDIKEIKSISSKIDTISPNNISNVTIFGATPLGVTIANTLKEMNLNIKIIEKDSDKASKAANILSDNIEIINTSYDDDEIFYNEEIKYSDVIITASLQDEDNIIKSIQAQKLGVKKIITVNNNLSYYSIMHSLNLSIIRGPKIAAYYEILEDIDSQSLIYERFFLGSKGKIFIKKIFNKKEITPPKEYAKILIIRDEKIIEITNTFKVLPEDIVIEFNFSGNKTWIEKL